MIEGGASEGARRVLQFWPQHLLFMGSIAIFEGHPLWERYKI